MRLVFMFLALTAMVLIPFAIWGESLTDTFSQEGSVAWLESYGNWAIFMGIVLLISDLFLPIPATVVMAALGFLYGPFWGGIISTVGSFLSGALAYGLCRLAGVKGAKWLLGEKDLEKGEKLFNKMGGWIVALSRWLPVFPEVIASLAGLSQMRSRSFFLALACGSIPLGFVFAYIGAMGVENPWLSLVLSAGIPPILWLGLRYLFKRELA